MVVIVPVNATVTVHAWAGAMGATSAGLALAAGALITLTLVTTPGHVSVKFARFDTNKFGDTIRMRSQPLVLKPGGPVSVQLSATACVLAPPNTNVCSGPTVPSLRSH